MFDLKLGLELLINRVNSLITFWLKLIIHTMFDSRVAMPCRASDVPPFSCNNVKSLSCDSGSSAISDIHISHAVPEQYLWVSLDGRMCWAYWRTLTCCTCRLAKAKSSLLRWTVGSKRLSVPAAMGSHSSTFHIHGPPRRLHESGLILEKAAESLKLFWRVLLPTGGQCSLCCKQTGEMKAEMTKLQKKLLEQKKKFHSTMKHLQLSKQQERVIFVTHEILCKAKENLKP